MTTYPCEVLYYTRKGSKWKPAKIVKRHGNQYICKVADCTGTGSYHHSEVRFPLSQDCKSAAQERLVGLWWYCNDYSKGQDSWQYRMLSNSRYKPGRLAAFEDEVVDEAEEYYNLLVRKFERKG